MTNEQNEKLLGILDKRFANDPQSFSSVHRLIKRHYDEQLKEAKKLHKEEMAQLRAETEARMQDLSDQMLVKHSAALARLEELAENGRKNSEETGTISQGLNQKVKDVLDLHKNLAKKFGEKFEKLDTRVEKISEFAVGAPNRSLYVNGALPSAYYSDTNFIAGTGVTLVSGTDETTQQATVTINSTSSGVTIETPAGTVDATNTVFTPSQEPTFVIADGVTYFENNGYTWDGTNITMSIPPSQYIRDAIS